MEELTGNASCCVFCLGPVEKHPPANGDGGLLEMEVNVMFIVKKLLSISSLECSELLKRFGNPSTWLETCQSCFEIVKEAWRVFQQICELEKELQEKRTEVKRKILRDEGRVNHRGRTGMGHATMEIRNTVLRNGCFEGKLDEYIKVEVEEMDNDWIGKSETEEYSFLDENVIDHVECKMDEDDADWSPEKMSKKCKPKKKGTNCTTRCTNKISPITLADQIQNSNVKCEYCVLRFENRTKLSSHVHHVHWVLKRGKKCTKSNERLPLDALRKHCLAEHKMSPCSNCPRLFPSKKALDVHLNRSHYLPKVIDPLPTTSKISTNSEDKKPTTVSPNAKNPLEIIDDISVELKTPLETNNFEENANFEKIIDKDFKTGEVTKKPRQRNTTKASALQIKRSYRKNKECQERAIVKNNRTHRHNCLFCTYGNNMRTIVQRHMSLEHKDEYSEYLKLNKDETKKSSVILTTVKTKVNSFEVHRCHHCNFCSAIKQKVTNHMLEMHKDLYSQSSSGNDSTTLIQCDKCPLSEEKRYKSENELIDHKVKVHNMLKCDKCSYMCTGLGYLENHQITYHSEQTLDPSAWFSKKGFNGRVRKTEKLKMKPPKTPQCKVCQEMFETRDQLTEHNLKQHPDDMFKCEKCTKIFDKLAFLCTHKTEVHNEPNNPYRCPECDYSNKFFRQVYDHQQTVHRKARRVVCEICSDSFSKETSLNYHKAQKHGIKSDTAPALTCNQCNKTFSMPSYLKCHIRTVHLGQWRYKCPRPDCGIGFVSQKQVDHHVNSVHDKIFPFVCSVEGCQSKYAGSWQLNAHIKNKHGPKKKCSYCDYESASSLNLKSHEEDVHDKSGSYQCDHCGKVYTTRKCLMQHLRMTHKISSVRKGKKATLTTFVQSVVSADRNNGTSPDEVESVSTD